MAEFKASSGAPDLRLRTSAQVTAYRGVVPMNTLAHAGIVGEHIEGALTKADLMRSASVPALAADLDLGRVAATLTREPYGIGQPMTPASISAQTNISWTYAEIFSIVRKCSISRSSRGTSTR